MFLPTYLKKQYIMKLEKRIQAIYLSGYFTELNEGSVDTAIDLLSKRPALLLYMISLLLDDRLYSYILNEGGVIDEDEVLLFECFPELLSERFRNIILKIKSENLELFNQKIGWLKDCHSSALEDALTMEKQQNQQDNK